MMIVPEDYDQEEAEHEQRQEYAEEESGSRRIGGLHSGSAGVILLQQQEEVEEEEEERVSSSNHHHGRLGNHGLGWKPRRRNRNNNNASSNSLLSPILLPHRTTTKRSHSSIVNTHNNNNNNGNKSNSNHNGKYMIMTRWLVYGGIGLALLWTAGLLGLYLYMPNSTTQASASTASKNSKSFFARYYYHPRMALFDASSTADTNSESASTSASTKGEQEPSPKAVEPTAAEQAKPAQPQPRGFLRQGKNQNQNINNGTKIIHDQASLVKHYPYPLHMVPADYTITAHSYTPAGGKRFTEYTSGAPPPYLPLSQETQQRSDAVAVSRLPYIKAAIQHAWNTGYVAHAFGRDNVHPVSGTGTDESGRIAVTMLDSLDTLWLSGLHAEFATACDYIRDHWTLQTNINGNDNDNNNENHPLVSVFETTIRGLAGLLSAYDWSGDPVFLDKALELGQRLLRAFDTNQAMSGFPYGRITLRNNHNDKNNEDGNVRRANLDWAGGGSYVVLAEVGTLQLEFQYLAHVAHNASLYHPTYHIYDVLEHMAPKNGLFPYFIDASTNNNNNKTPTFANDKLTFGAMADSVYEYFLKVWIQGGRKDQRLRRMYDKAIDSMHKELLHISYPSQLVFVADKNTHSGTVDAKMDHLVCFLGGVLALGAYTDPLGLQSKRAQRDLQTGRALTYTCYQMYARMQPTGIAPEFVQFNNNYSKQKTTNTTTTTMTDAENLEKEKAEQKPEQDPSKEEEDFTIGRNAPHYLLRPEAVESFYVLHALTGDPIYREWGWEVFQSIEAFCRTEFAYGALNNVQDIEPPRDEMESFFIAETLKYLYLLNDPHSPVDILHTHVFNTEAHPLRILSRIDTNNNNNNNGNVINHNAANANANGAANAAAAK